MVLCTWLTSILFSYSQNIYHSCMLLCVEAWYLESWLGGNRKKTTILSSGNSDKTHPQNKAILTQADNHNTCNSQTIYGYTFLLLSGYGCVGMEERRFCHFYKDLSSPQCSKYTESCLSRNLLEHKPNLLYNKNRLPTWTPRDVSLLGTIVQQVFTVHVNCMVFLAGSLIMY